MNGPFRAAERPSYPFPGLRPGLTETALQAENTARGRAADRGSLPWGRTNRLELVNKRAGKRDFAIALPPTPGLLLGPPPRATTNLHLERSVRRGPPPCSRPNFPSRPCRCSL